MLHFFYFTKVECFSINILDGKGEGDGDVFDFSHKSKFRYRINRCMIFSVNDKFIIKHLTSPDTPKSMSYLHPINWYGDHFNDLSLQRSYVRKNVLASSLFGVMTLHYMFFEFHFVMSAWCMQRHLISRPWTEITL